jgi:hypothetical protein
VTYARGQAYFNSSYFDKTESVTVPGRSKACVCVAKRKVRATGAAPEWKTQTPLAPLGFMVAFWSLRAWIYERLGPVRDLFNSTASAAASLRSRWGSVRSLPECNKQR